MNSTGVFGLHANAEITYFTNSAKLMWENLLSMQATDGDSGGSSNTDDYII